MEQRATGSTGRLQRLIAFVAIALVAAATAVAFGRVFEGGLTTLELLAAAVGSAAVAAALERRNLLVATIVSGALMIALVGAFVFHASTWHGLPTLDTLRAMGDAAGQVGEQARIEVAPTPPFTPLLMAGLIAIWAAIFSSHALAFRAGSPLLGLLPPVALLAFADTVLEDSVRPNYGVLFLIGALAVVFVDGVRRVQRWGPIWTWPGSRRRNSVTSTRGARRVAIAAVAVAAVAPLVLPGFSSRAVLDLNGAPDRGPVHLDPQVAIGQQLQRPDPVDVMHVQTQQAAYSRMYALDSFDGNQWTAHLSATPLHLTPGETLPQTPEIGASTTTITQHFTVTNDLVIPGIPAASPVRSVTAPGLTLTYDQNLGIVLTNGALTNGTQYTSTSILIQPTAKELNDVPDASMHDSGFAQWTQLPATRGMKDIEALTHDWTDTASTPFEKVMAIQDHLTSPDYTYDANVSQQDDSFTLDTFLRSSKTGYCQQFATAMAIMVRELGYPARIAVGFTYGTAVEGTPNEFTISSSDYHSWPEVYFPGYGWLAFEPTPKFFNPTASVYTDPLHAGQTQSTHNETTTSSRSNGDVAPQLARFVPRSQSPGCRARGCSSNATPTPAPAGPFKIPAGIVALVLVGIVVLALLVIPPVRAVSRRRQLRRAGADPGARVLATFAVFSERAGDLGLGRATGETLDEYRVRLATTGLLSNGDLELLTRLAARAAYSTAALGPGDVSSAHDAADAVVQDLRKGTGIAQRVLGAYGIGR